MQRLDDNSRMSGDVHVRFCERLGVRFPRATRLVCAFQYRSDAERFYGMLPKRLEKFGLRVAPDKTRIVRFSRFHPGLRRRFTFLSFELYWERDRCGELRVMKRTARRRLQRAKRQLTQWIKANRHLPGRRFIDSLNRRLVGHYNYFGVRGNERGLYSFFVHAIRCAFKWLNRRGGKRRSFTWSRFKAALQRLRVVWPRTVERQHAHRIFA